MSLCSCEFDASLSGSLSAKSNARHVIALVSIGAILNVVRGESDGKKLDHKISGKESVCMRRKVGARICKCGRRDWGLTFDVEYATVSRCPSSPPRTRPPPPMSISPCYLERDGMNELEILGTHTVVAAHSTCIVHAVSSVHVTNTCYDRHDTYSGIASTEQRRLQHYTPEYRPQHHQGRIPHSAAMSRAQAGFP
jgi:hypothetical protein